MRLDSEAFRLDPFSEDRDERIPRRPDFSQVVVGRNDGWLCATHVVAAYAKGWLDRRFVRLAARARVKSEEERQRRGRILEFIRTDKDALTIFVVEIAVEASLGAAMSVIAILLSGGVLGLDLLKTRPAGQPGARPT